MITDLPELTVTRLCGYLLPPPPKNHTQADIDYYLYKVEQRLLQYLKDNLSDCKVDSENWPGIATIMIRHDAFISPIMIRQKVDTIYEIVYKVYTYGHDVDKNLVLNYKPSRFVQNLIGTTADLIYFSFPHPDKNVMENNKMMGREFGQKIIPILKEKEYIEEVSNFDTILSFVNNYLQNMKKALKRAQIKSIS